MARMNALKQVKMMANKLWGGRFDKAADEEMYSFLSSENVALDFALAKYDIEGSLAHVCMLAKQGILVKKEAGEILSALLQVFLVVLLGWIKLRGWRRVKSSLDRRLIFLKRRRKPVRRWP